MHVPTWSITINPGCLSTRSTAHLYVVSFVGYSPRQEALVLRSNVLCRYNFISTSVRFFRLRWTNTYKENGYQIKNLF